MAPDIKDAGDHGEDGKRQKTDATENEDEVGTSTTAEDGDDDDETEDDGDEEEEEDEEEEDEPKLKHARLTSHLAPVYRNGDATSTFLVTGDKMFIGTHNGNIHVLSLPTFQSVRVYHAHTASVTSLSISPFPPPTSQAPRLLAVDRIASQSQKLPQRSVSVTSTSSSSPRARKPQVVPNTPSNAIYIATSSTDGNVCVASLVDIKDVQLRNFARPVQAVALSPDYKNDRTYLSGGLAGNLVLTVGGRAGTNTKSTTTGTASATAAGWLGTIGLGSNTGIDKVLHSGEGTISTIKWSLSEKYVVWINEYGIKIMRSHLHLDSEDSEFAWKRFAHVDPPYDGDWEEMASVWKSRVEWIDEKSLETDDDDSAREKMSPATAKLKQYSSNSRVEKLLVGWGDGIWIINIHPGGTGVGRNVGEKTVGRAEKIKFLRMDCIVSGLSLYTPTLLVVLAHVRPEDNVHGKESHGAKGHKAKSSAASTGSEPSGGIRHRQNSLPPELRLIDLESEEEIETDNLIVSRFERLSASDYHLCILPAKRVAPTALSSRGTLETLAGMGSGMWNATLNATAILSSAASIRSSGSNSERDSNAKGPGSRILGHREQPAHPDLATPGMKLFIHSPYDCILASKRDLSDHLSWLLDHKQFQQAWQLVDDHPEVISSNTERLADIGPDVSDRRKDGSDDTADDFYDEASSAVDSASQLINSSVEKEKHRIGELWIQSFIESGDWNSAGKVCGKVLGTSHPWEHWVLTFAGADKFDEIVNYIPSAHIQPPLPSMIYELVLGHYITVNRPRLKDLLTAWSSDLFDISTVTTALENQLKYRDVREDSIEDGEKGRDWRIVMECLGKLYTDDGRPREALRCYMRLRDADAAMALIKEYHLVDAVADDIPGFILLRVAKEQVRTASIIELENATSEAIALLVSEAQHGLVRPEIVVSQLQDKKEPLYIFFYLRSLWLGDGIEEESRQARDKMMIESRYLVDEFADLAVRSFAAYDRPLLMEYLKSSTSYTFEKATQVCEESEFVPELVYLYSKTGQTKRALHLIISRLDDVSQAISFAKNQDDPDLWEDLLNYSMDKPRFIRGLLEEVGTAINPITLVRRIPEGLEIEGLREGLSRMIREYELQHSISTGVARVLRGEVASAQDTLRLGQRKGVKFDVVIKGNNHLDVEPSDVHSKIASSLDGDTLKGSNSRTNVLISTTTTTTLNVNRDGGHKSQCNGHHMKHEHKPGHCVSCAAPFTPNETETLVGFACGHVFHLSHLLSFLNPDAVVDESDTAGAFRLREGNEIIEWEGRSVFPKVTHARLLRGRVSEGCPVCAGREEGFVVNGFGF